MGTSLDTLTIKGFKSIQELNAFKLNSLNVIVGANGAGKSNLIAFFKMLRALIDGNLLPRDLPMPGQAVIKGDARSLSIAAASLVAKFLRDRIMVDLAQQHPGYGWEVNAGYPTKAHRQALLDLGVTPYHRRSFRPVHNILCKG